MSLKDKQPLKEGPLDFLRGAGSEMGRKISQSAPVQAGREVIQAGKVGSAAGDKRAELNKISAQLANLLAYIEKLAPMVQQPAQADQQQSQQPAQQAQAKAPVQAAQTKDPFKPDHKPHVVNKPGYGMQYQFNSFMQAVHGDQEELKEGLWDFVKGAGRAAGEKVRDKVNAYASKGSVLNDIYSAGVKAHGDAKAIKQSEQMQQAQAKHAQAKKQASDLLKQLFTTAAAFGDNSGAELLNAARKSGGNKAQRIAELIKMYGPKYGVNI